MRNFEGESSCYGDRTTKNIEYRTNTEDIAYYYLIIFSTLELNIILTSQISRAAFWRRLNLPC